MKEENGFYIAEDESDFEGYEIIYIEYWNDNTRRVHMRKIDGPRGNFFMVYVDIELANKLKEAS